MYNTDDNLPEIVDGHRQCIKSEMSTFCIEWTCPDPECDNPTKPETGCPFCQGMYRKSCNVSYMHAKIMFRQY